MPTVGGIPPVDPHRLYLKRAQRVGMVWRDINDHNVAVAEELERQKGIPQKNTERWKKWKDENGVRPRGYDTLEVWRDPRTMRFSKPPTPQQLAQMFGMKTGADLPIPNRRNDVKP